MVLDKTNILNLDISNKEKKILLSLYHDILEINQEYNKEFSIFYQDWHNEYSPERTDPCPDYYGTYKLFHGTLDLGIELSLDELDTVMCFLYDLASYNLLSDA